MNENLTTGWSPTERVIFRFFFTYLVLFFVFVPHSFLKEPFPFLDFLDLPSKFITTPLITWIGKKVFQIMFPDNWYGDNLFTYVTTLVFFILSILITIIWSLLDKRKAYHTLYRYMHLYTRYFLAYILFSYGFNKLSGIQFYPPTPSRMLQPFGQLEYRSVLWSFMGASGSYTFFSGLIETICGLLLLFRKTSTLGALLTLGTLGNVLMINIGYDVMVKVLLFHYLFISLFIMAHNAKNLYRLFILHKQASFSIVPLFIKPTKFKWLVYGLKLSLIFCILFPLTKGEIRKVSSRMKIRPMDGIYIVEEFNLGNQVRSPLTTDTLRWKKMATRHNADMAIQYMNDSLKFYTYKMDTSAKIFLLNDSRDKSFKCQFRYTNPSPKHYLFEGVLNSDSVRILVRKFDMDSIPLVKNRGRIKWYQ